MNPADEKHLEWTGERYVPEITGNIRLEHLHRYLIARELSRDKRVLDIACGEGYGSNLLATVAANVVGVDIARNAIDHAAARYRRPNLQFKQGSCESIPLPDGAVDVVVSFETIEHLSSHDAMMREVRRVLGAHGLLVISNPERHEYSEVLGNKNVYHVKELYREEFELLLRDHFLNVAIAGQRIQGGSIVAPLGEATNTSFVTFPFAENSSADVTPTSGMLAPVYILALASDKPLPRMPVGLLDGGQLVWASDWPALLSQVQGRWTEEISRRLGDPVSLEGASPETVNAEFTRQAERVTNLVTSLAVQSSHVQDANAKSATDHIQLQETIAKLAKEDVQLHEAFTKIAAQEIQLQEARSYAERLGNQFLDANSKLLTVHTELVNARAIAKAHASTEEWLERKAHGLESDLEAQKRSWQDREEALVRDLAQAEAQLADAQARAQRTQSALETFQRAAAKLAAAEDLIAHLQSMISGLKTQVQTYEQSRSWRLTAPLRAVRRRGRAVVPPSALELSGIPVNTATNEAPTTEGNVSAFETAVQAETVPRSRGEAMEPRAPDVMPAWAYADSTQEYVPLDRSTPVDTRVRLIAFYLPQFHPISENDAWWGKGFTEWTSVTRAKPQFEGHYQPHLPGELGFYDLRVPEVQRRQVELARLHGVHGFCFYHYWFQGRKLLQRPLEQFLSSDIDFAFCVCWANENWTRRWDGRDDEWLMVQQHSAEDDLAFIRDIEPALRDRRCIRIGGRALLLVYRPALFPDAAASAQRWRGYCREVGIGELYLMSTHAFDGINPHDIGFDAALEFVPNTVSTAPINDEIPNLNPQFRGTVYDYRSLVDATVNRETPREYPFFRSVMPMWDNEPRRPNQGAVFARSSPALYQSWLESTCRWTERHIQIESPLVFVNAWNEWGEGAHLEPDRRHGYAYLKATADALAQFPTPKDRPSIVCVSHDAYLYGAQLIILNVARTLSKRLGYDVEVLLCGPGQLKAEFESVARVQDLSSPQLTRDDKIAVVRELHARGSRIALCNTSVVGELAEILKLQGFFVISLIHELPGVVRQYELESSIDRIVRFADRVVFPAEVVRDRFNPPSGMPLQSTAIIPQGLYAPNKYFGRRESARRELRGLLNLDRPTRIVLAVGSADRRKGIDLFVDVGIEVANQLRDVVFVWVGSPEPSVFGEAQGRIEESSRTDRFIFPGPVRDADLFFAGADAYLMTSREDPFPSVVLEALDAELPVIGFEGAGGFVELLRRGCGVVVPYTDTDAMSDALLQVLNSSAENAQFVDNARAILSREFSYVNYSRDLIELAGTTGPRVSVIVPNYNYARYLPQRLQGILNQTYPPHEVLFLDDCSTDDSLEIAARMLHASGLSYRIVPNERNQGTYRQWMRGMREATGDLVWIAEADDDCAPTLLEMLVRQFERPDVVLAYCQSRQIDEEGQELSPDYLAWTSDISHTKWRETYVRPGIEEICDCLAVKNTIPNVSAVLMRRIDPSGIEGELLSLRNAGDWLFYVHLLERGSIAFIPDALNSHRRHAGGVTIGANSLNLMREILIVQQYVIQRYNVSPDTLTKRESDLQRTYEYLGLSSAGPASYKDHEDLRAVESPR